MVEPGLIEIVVFDGSSVRLAFSFDVENSFIDLILAAVSVI